MPNIEVRAGDIVEVDKRPFIAGHAPVGTTKVCTVLHTALNGQVYVDPIGDGSPMYVWPSDVVRVVKRQVA